MFISVDTLTIKAFGYLINLVEEHYKVDGAYNVLVKTVMSEIEKNVEFLGKRIMEENLASESLIEIYSRWLRLEDRAEQWLDPLSYPAIYVRDD